MTTLDLYIVLYTALCCAVTLSLCILAVCV